MVDKIAPMTNPMTPSCSARAVDCRGAIGRVDRSTFHRVLTSFLQTEGLTLEVAPSETGPPQLPFTKPLNPPCKEDSIGSVKGSWGVREGIQFY